MAEKLGITLPSQNIELGTSHDFSWLVRMTTMHALRDDRLTQAEIAAKTTSYLDPAEIGNTVP
jgi:hypothetical protein